MSSKDPLVRKIIMEKSSPISTKTSFNRASSFPKNGSIKNEKVLWMILDDQNGTLVESNTHRCDSKIYSQSSLPSIKDNEVESSSVASVVDEAAMKKVRFLPDLQRKPLRRNYSALYMDDEDSIEPILTGRNIAMKHRAPPVPSPSQTI